MECDKNMGLIKKNTIAEVPEDWVNTFKMARQNPRPFIVIPIEQNIVRDWASFLKNKIMYKPKCPFKTRPIREAMVSKEDEMFRHRNSYNGAWTSENLYCPLVKDENIQYKPQGEHEFLWPDPAYNGK